MKGATGVIVFLTAVAAALAVGLHRERIVTRQLLAQAQVQRTELEDLRPEVQHLRHFHRSVVPALDPFVTGTDVVGDSSVTISGAQDGLYYALQTSCATCPLNFPALRALADSAHGEFVVAAFSLVDSLPVLVEYADRHQLSFPLLHDLGGGVVDLIPRLGTPFTIVVSDGCVAATAVGKFSAAEVERFAFFSKRPGAGRALEWAGC